MGNLYWFPTPPDPADPKAGKKAWDAAVDALFQPMLALIEINGPDVTEDTIESWRTDVLAPAISTAIDFMKKRVNIGFYAGMASGLLLAQIPTRLPSMLEEHESTHEPIDPFTKRLILNRASKLVQYRVR